MGKLWEIKQSALPKTVDIYIYSDIEPDSYDCLTDGKIVSKTSANHFRDELAKIGELDNINIYINSLGGSVMEGVAIYNQLKRHKAYKTVYIDGFACSVASVIAMAGNKVVMPRNTTMMIHNAWSWACGNAEQLRKCAADLDKINESSRQAYLLKAGDKLSEDKLIEMMNNETYLTAMECVEYGLADEFAGAEADIEKAKQALQQAKENGFNQLTSRLGKICALASLPTERTPASADGYSGQEIKQETLDHMQKLFESFLQSTAK